MWYHAAAAVTAATLFATAPVREAAVMCAAVEGSADARVSSMRPARSGLRLSGRGESQGDLAGPLEVGVVKSFSGQPLTVEFEIATAAGTALAAGSATTIGSANERQIESDLIVRGGTGSYTQATGTLRVRGTMNVRERTLRVTYEGRICSPANELTPTRDRRQTPLSVASHR